MNKFLICLAACAAVVLPSCSDDDEPTVTNPVDNVFPNGLPATVDGASFTVDDQGRMTRITDGSDVVTFEYGTFTHGDQYQAVMKLRDTSYPDDNSDIYLKLNEQGYVTYALQTYSDPQEADQTWKFSYDNQGHLVRLQRSEGGDDFKITYTDGNITKVVQDETDGDHREYTIFYTNGQFTKAVANKGNIMLFDDCFHIDMDEMGLAYYAGMLGKATLDLPMSYSMTGIEGGSPYTDKDTYNWTFNSNNLPTKFWPGNYPYDAVTFSWR